MKRSGCSTPTRKARSTLSKFAYSPTTPSKKVTPSKTRKLPPGNTKAGLRARFRVLALETAQRQPCIPPSCGHPSLDQLMYLTGGVNDGRLYRVVRSFSIVATALD